MINAKLVTCGLCHSYYADPRQIPCAHSFCFDCISGRLNEETLTLICPKCEKVHQYTTVEEFKSRCMPDGFLATMVTQFKRNQSRLSAVPSSLSSRPPSTISHATPVFASTPLPLTPTQEIHFNSYNRSGSERSTPSVFNQARPPSTTNTRALVAKCQSCNIRGELIVCNHCDNVICVKCADEHRSVINDDVKHEWDICKGKFETIHEQSMRFDENEEEANQKARSLQTCISEQSNRLVQTIETHKNTYIDVIEKYRRTFKQSFPHEQVIDEYESIDKRLEELLRSPDVSTDKINDFLFEIEHLEGRLDNLNKFVDANELKFPVLALPGKIDMTFLLGKLEFAHSNTESADFDPYSVQLVNGHNGFQVKSDDEDDAIVHLPIQPPPRSFLPSKTEPIFSSSSSVIPNVQKKKLLWQIDYFSVPYYVRKHENHLFICDKYGSLAVYKINKSNDLHQKPTFVRDIKLFKDNPISNTADDDQTIIDSFVVHKLWIIVFKRKKNELHGTIYLFTHDGKPVPNGKCAHNYPSRELTIDTERNVLWSLDQKQLSLFYYDLPESKPTKPDEYFLNRHSHVQFSKPFAPIHISVNNNALAVLDKNRQAVHVYEKNSKQQLYEHVNMYGHSTHFCWDMALFSDNSLLIKLDDMSTLKAGPSKHIYLQLDTTKQHNIIAMIEETDAYGMMITPTDEILIGVRINTKGIVKCYV